MIIEEEEDDTFIRDRQDVFYICCSTSPCDRRRRGEYTYIDGKRVRLKVVAGTQPGKSVRLRGKGLPQCGYGHGMGD